MWVTLMLDLPPYIANLVCKRCRPVRYLSESHSSGEYDSPWGQQPVHCKIPPIPELLLPSNDHTSSDGSRQTAERRWHHGREFLSFPAPTWPTCVREKLRSPGIRGGAGAGTVGLVSR